MQYGVFLQNSRECPPRQIPLLKNVLCTEEDAARIEALIKKCGLPTELPYTAEALANAALSDKKRAGSTLPVITVEGLGRCTVRKIAASDYAGWLRQGGAK